MFQRILDAVQYVTDDVTGHENRVSLVAVQSLSRRFNRILSVRFVAICPDSHTPLVHTTPDNRTILTHWNPYFRGDSTVSYHETETTVVPQQRLADDMHTAGPLLVCIFGRERSRRGNPVFSDADRDSSPGEYQPKIELAMNSPIDAPITRG
ncbi:MAG: hypothetical protein ACI8XM_001222, partial [Haloarculaceae archaeon]